MSLNYSMFFKSPSSGQDPTTGVSGRIASFALAGGGRLAK